jgi:hypothetical protein
MIKSYLINRINLKQPIGIKNLKNSESGFDVLGLILIVELKIQGIIINYY